MQNCKVRLWKKYSQAESGLTIWIKAALADGRLIELDPLFASTQFMALLKSFAFLAANHRSYAFADAQHKKLIISSSVEMFLKQYQAK